MFPKELFNNLPATLTVPRCPSETIDIIFLDNRKAVSGNYHFYYNLESNAFILIGTNQGTHPEWIPVAVWDYRRNPVLGNKKGTRSYTSG